jgi:hypothetical protein
VFYRKQWCAGGESDSCVGGRIMAKACFIWRCWEYVIYEANNCGDSTH